MKKFFVRMLILAACVVAIDLAAGLIFPKLVASAKGGDNWRNNYICNETSEDILVFGSSRALHHYNSQILIDSLGMSCYNCAQDGNGIILNHGRLEMIQERYSPKIVIYDIIPRFDILEIEDNHKYLKWLKAYYDRDGIPDIFYSIDKKENYKMMSNMYRYNSSFVQIVSDCINPLQSSGICGYRPIYAEMDTLKVQRKSNAPKPAVQYDSLKLQYWKKFLDATSNSQVIFVISPIWYGMDEEDYRPLLEMAESHGVPFLNFANDSKYLGNPIYFKDGFHLNAHGADEFTKDLVVALKERGLL